MDSRSRVSAYDPPTRYIFRLFRNDEFLKYWLGVNATALADGMAQGLLILVLLDLTQGVATDLTRLSIFHFLPFILFGLLAGLLCDRLSRRSVLIWTNAARCALMAVAGMILLAPLQTSTLSLGGFSPFSALALFFLNSSLLVTHVLAKLALLPQLVRPGELLAANAFRTFSEVTAVLLGGGLVVFLAGRTMEVNLFLICSSLYFLSVLGYILLQPVPSPRLSNLTDNIRTMEAELRAYLNRHKKTLHWLGLSVALSVLASFFYLALEHLSLQQTTTPGQQGFKHLMHWLDAGMMMGGVWILLWAKPPKLAYLLAGAFLVIFGATLTAGWALSMGWMPVWMVLLGIANVTLLVLLDTFFQRAVPGRLLGMVLGLRFLLTNGVFLLVFLCLAPFLAAVPSQQLMQTLGLASGGVALVIAAWNPGFFYFLLRSLLTPVFKLFFSFQVEGREHLNAPRVLLAGNHTGFLDGPLLLAALGRPVRFMVAQAVLGWPVIGWLVRRAGIIPVVPRREKQTMKHAVEVLKTGHMVAIFPEGKLTLDGEIQPFQRGVAMLQRQSGSTLVPFAIHGGYEAWHWGMWLPKPRRIVLQFGQPILPPEATDSATDGVRVSDLQARIAFMKGALDRRERAEHDEVYPESVLSLMLKQSDRFGANPALRYRKDGRWQEISYIELSRQARMLSDYLIEQGIERGDRIAILSEGCPEWGIALFAAIRCGAIIVPLDTKLTPSELQAILDDARPRVLLCASVFWETVRALRSACPWLEYVYTLDTPETPDSEAPACIRTLQAKESQEGRERALEEDGFILYTSGTTGEPKGVVIPFQSVVFEARALETVMGIDHRDVFLSMLPLNHLLELTCGFLSVLNAGGRVYYAQTLFPQELVSLMRDVRVSYLITVPLFLKLLKEGVEREVSQASPFHRMAFQAALGVSGVFPVRPLRRALFRSLHQRFGGRLRGFVCGGAALDPSVEQFFEALGVPIYQGYGLTETGPVISVNTPRVYRLGSVGKPLPGVEVRIESHPEISSDSSVGEIWTRGPHVMRGYYRRPDWTEEALTPEGWFKTGDLGTLDAEGFLHIRGRLKNLIVMGNGKKVSPEEVEEAISESEHVQDACVLGIPAWQGIHRGTEVVCAVVVPVEAIWAATLEGREVLERDVLSRCHRLAPYKRPAMVLLYPEEFPKTSSRKIKRAIIKAWADDYAARLADSY